jgi:hypothetical protein
MKEQVPMLTAAIDFWLLPAELFFKALAPAPKHVVAEIIPLASDAHRIRRRRKVIRSKRGDVAFALRNDFSSGDIRPSDKQRRLASA